MSRVERTHRLSDRYAGERAIGSGNGLRVGIYPRPGRSDVCRLPISAKCRGRKPARFEANGLVTEHLLATVNNCLCRPWNILIRSDLAKPALADWARWGK